MADPYRIFAHSNASSAGANPEAIAPATVFPFPAQPKPGALPRARTQPVKPAPTQTKKRSTRRILFWMVLAALALRVTVALCTYQDRMNPVMTYWFLGQEEGHVAASIASGHGFGNPLYTQTGPTAWFAPIYPYILAADFKIFGTFTVASCIAILMFDALVSALTCIPIFLFARRGFGEGAALAAGWTWVFYPYSVYWPVYRIWDTWLVTLLLAICFYAIFKLERTSKVKHWVAFGVLAGFAALVDPIVMSVLPILCLWALWRLYKRSNANAATVETLGRKRALRGDYSDGRTLRQSGVEPTHSKTNADFSRVKTAALGMTVKKASLGRLFACGVCCIAAVVLTISPWMIRNAVVFHKFIPIRDNLPLEFRVGNNGDSSEPLIINAGPWVPWVDNTEWNEYTQMGEIAYFHLKGEQARAYIEAHPLWYAGMMARRFVYVWTGFWSFSARYMADPYDNHKIDFVTTPLLALLSVLTFMGLARAYRRHGAGVATPYAIVLIFFPMIYYLTHVGGWYRCPMGPMIIPLAAYEVHARAAEWVRRRRQIKFAEAPAILAENGSEISAEPVS
ncbi:MAG TPA: glycosyltransferase family 39 protein [Verrucomicrobiae bacterium]|nr:glycosyltransferase family 39 protein [Verrucomicrobiae bacterium]